MSNHDRKRRKRLGEPYAPKGKHEPTPLLQRTLSSRALTDQIKARGLEDEFLRLYEEVTGVQTTAR